MLHISLDHGLAESMNDHQHIPNVGVPKTIYMLTQADEDYAKVHLRESYRLLPTQTLITICNSEIVEQTDLLTEIAYRSLQTMSIVREEKLGCHFREYIDICTRLALQASDDFLRMCLRVVRKADMFDVINNIAPTIAALPNSIMVELVSQSGDELVSPWDYLYTVLTHVKVGTKTCSRLFEYIFEYFNHKGVVKLIILNSTLNCHLIKETIGKVELGEMLRLCDKYNNDNVKTILLDKV